MGCFTAASTVQTIDGKLKQMSELQIGDRVLSMDGKGNLRYSEVFMFLDRNENEWREFVKIDVDGNTSITATPSHLIYARRTATTKMAEYTFAGHLSEGDFVLVNIDGILEPRKIINISREIHQGVYAPLTYEGSIVVSSISASCYAVIDNQNVAHYSFMPMRIYYSIKSLFINSTNEVPRGVHWYAEGLNKLKDIILPYKWFYKT